MFQRCQQTLRQLTAVPPPWVSKRFALRSGELLRFVCNVLSACFSAGSRLLVVIVQFQRKDTDPQLIGNWCHSITQYTKRWTIRIVNRTIICKLRFSVMWISRRVPVPASTTHRICMGLRGAFKSHHVAPAPPRKARSENSAVFKVLNSQILTRWERFIYDHSPRLRKHMPNSADEGSRGKCETG